MQQTSAKQLPTQQEQPVKTLLRMRLDQHHRVHLNIKLNLILIHLLLDRKGVVMKVQSKERDDESIFDRTELNVNQSRVKSLRQKQFENRNPIKREASNDLQRTNLTGHRIVSQSN